MTLKTLRENPNLSEEMKKRKRSPGMEMIQIETHQVHPPCSRLSIADEVQEAFKGV